jgi:hypothetical protein
MRGQQRQVVIEGPSWVSTSVFPGEDGFAFRALVIALPFVARPERVHVRQSERPCFRVVGNSYQPTLVPDLCGIHHFEFA